MLKIRPYLPYDELNEVYFTRYRISVGLKMLVSMCIGYNKTSNEFQNIIF